MAGDSSARQRLRAVLIELQQEAFELRRRRDAATVIRDVRWQRLCIEILHSKDATLSQGSSGLNDAALELLSHVRDPAVVRAVADLLPGATNTLSKICHTLR